MYFVTTSDIRMDMKEIVGKHYNGFFKSIFIFATPLGQTEGHYEIFRLG
jgi:hypothetical protein